VSWTVNLRVVVKDLHAFKEACELNDVNLNWDNLKLYGKNNVYLGKLNEDKKDDDGSVSYTLQTDSDFVSENRRCKEQTNMHVLMQDYSEIVCRRRIGSVGTILERTQDERGILLKVAING
jgi:hypothetical protein